VLLIAAYFIRAQRFGQFVAGCVKAARQRIEDAERVIASHLQPLERFWQNSKRIENEHLSLR
jgi:hypothetical protein